jgi:hypothetical protein
MENKITYKEVSDREVAVFMEGRRVGTIRPLLAGWRYYPKGQSQGGDKYPTLTLVKQSLEG